MPARIDSEREARAKRLTVHGEDRPVRSRVGDDQDDRRDPPIALLDSRDIRAAFAAGRLPGRDGLLVI